MSRETRLRRAQKRAEDARSLAYVAPKPSGSLSRKAKELGHPYPPVKASAV